MFTLKIRRVGNSAAVTLPKEVLAKLRVREGDTLVLTEGKEGLYLTPYDQTFHDAMKAFGETRRKYRNALRELGR
ncbi:MAG: AbrB/MazE/SpoVT family DNA-binding domain-containing protein [Planctomycetota bacterium]|nr:AbrB/MazE/SpoVT family DNA-binding domain-containing protein [Planctomycetota bacterium]